MATEFERGFYKASVFQASLNILSNRGNNEPTLCEVLDLIKRERRRSRAFPLQCDKVLEEAAKIRGYEIRRILKKPSDSILSGREYNKGLTVYRKEMKNKSLVFRKIQKDSVL